MTDLGSFENPLSMHGERWRLETRTDDPASPADDERWVRTDLDDDNRLATIKCGDGTEIPIFPPGTAEETVREAIRVRVNGQTGYAPIVPVDDSNIPARRIQHDGQPHAFHDRVEPGSATPDSAVVRAADNNTVSGFTGKRGIEISVGSSYPEYSQIEAKISGNADPGLTRAQVIRMSDGTIIDTQDVTNLGPGDVFTFDAKLLQNTNYSVIIDAEGAEYAMGYRKEGDTNYPYTDPGIDIDIVGGIIGDGTESGGGAFHVLGVGGF